MEEHTDHDQRAQDTVAERSLQRGAEGEVEAFAPPPGWLVEFDLSAESQAVDRILADTAVLFQLQLAGYEGPAWDEFADVVGRYGFAVDRVWLARGEMVDRCRAKGIVRGLPSGKFAGPLSFRLADDLANWLVAESLISFRDKVLRTNLWDPTAGSSLKTFFVGQTMVRYPDVLRRWRREEADPDWVPLVYEDLLEEPSTLYDPERMVVEREALREAGETLDPRTLKVVQLNTAGFSHAEIAEVLGGSANERVVEGILHRHRKRQERKGA